MFTVHHYNFGTTYEFSTLANAREWATKVAFEALIRNPSGHLVAMFSPISGWRTF